METQENRDVPEFDILGTEPRFVRPFDVRRGRFIEFDFGVGDEDMSVELVMPLREFLIFAKRQAARWRQPEEAEIEQAIKDLARDEHALEELEELIETSENAQQ